MEIEPEQELNPRDRKCPICGRKEYAWGELRVGKNPPGEFVYYRPPGSTWDDGDIPTFVRSCRVCGNIQLFENDK